LPQKENVRKWKKSKTRSVHKWEEKKGDLAVSVEQVAKKTFGKKNRYWMKRGGGGKRAGSL